MRITQSIPSPTQKFAQRLHNSSILRELFSGTVSLLTLWLVPMSAYVLINRHRQQSDGPVIYADAEHSESGEEGHSSEEE